MGTRTREWAHANDPQGPPNRVTLSPSSGWFDPKHWWVRPLPPSLVDRHSAQVAIASLPGISSSLDSLFRVLCIFPLRYLCANGLLPCYLALGGIYHPPKKIIQVALSSNPTRRQPKKKNFKVKNPSKGPPLPGVERGVQFGSSPF